MVLLITYAAQGKKDNLCSVFYIYVFVRYITPKKKVRANFFKTGF